MCEDEADERCSLGSADNSECAAASIQPLAAPAAPEAAEAMPAAQQHREAPEQQPEQQAQQQGPAQARGRDYTAVPKYMDERFERLGAGGFVRPTIISPGEEWQKEEQEGLLARPTTRTLDSEEQSQEKTAAFDLLDALTKSGSLAVHGSLHVVVAATHCFDKSVMETVVQDNRNPIDKVELTTL